MSGKKNFAGISSQMDRAVGENQTKSKEDDLESTLQSYKKNHPSVQVNLSKSAKIIRSLRNSLACDSLATEGVLVEAASLFDISRSHSEPSCAIVTDFLVDADVPELLVEVLRSLYQKYPVFSSEEQTNSQVKCAVQVIYVISVAILNFSDLHEKFCEACGQAGLVEEYLKLLRGLKMCTHDFSDTRVSPSVTECMQMTSRPPCLHTLQNGGDFKIR